MQYSFGKSITELKKQAMDSINQAAYEKITSDYPIWKQINYNTRALELVLANTISSEEHIELKKIQSVFTYINSIRELSNTLVAAIISCACPVQLRQLEMDSVIQIKNT